jgi:hypothetical protein
LQIISATEEKLIHEEDLQFHLQLLVELGGFESDTEEEKDDLSLQIIDRQNTQKPKQKEKKADRNLTKAVKQEAKEKAQTWQQQRHRS